MHRVSEHHRGGRARRRAPACNSGGCVMNATVKSAPIPPSRQREKPGQPLKWIGKNIKRVEDPRLLTGQGRYIDDIDLPNMLHAAVIGSTRANARIKSIDVGPATELRGVEIGRASWRER